MSSDALDPQRMSSVCFGCPVVTLALDLAAPMRSQSEGVELWYELWQMMRQHDIGQYWRAWTQLSIACWLTTPVVGPLCPWQTEATTLVAM